MEVQLIGEEFKKIDSSDTTFSVPQRKKVLREMQLQKLQKVAQLPGMESYEAIDRDRLPKAYHTFQPFVNQSVSLESSKSMVFGPKSGHFGFELASNRDLKLRLAAK